MEENTYQIELLKSIRNWLRFIGIVIILGILASIVPMIFAFFHLL
ncbi:hypothetical protein [Salegentibacter lacus]|nr:hypothetical protein [Salegentibacter lacus]